MTCQKNERYVPIPHNIGQFEDCLPSERNVEKCPMHPPTLYGGQRIFGIARRANWRASFISDYLDKAKANERIVFNNQDRASVQGHACTIVS
jgi:hypothetical protein